MIQAPEVFATERLVMRRPLLSDAADIYEYAHDSEVTRYMEWRTHSDIRQSVEFLKACAAQWESDEEFCWVIIPGRIWQSPKGRRDMIPCASPSSVRQHPWPYDLALTGSVRKILRINLKTAKQIGLTIPPNVLARADKVIR